MLHQAEKEYIDDTGNGLQLPSPVCEPQIATKCTQAEAEQNSFLSEIGMLSA